MKVLSINETWGLSGGQEEYILQVGNGLAARGHTVLLVYGGLVGEKIDSSQIHFGELGIKNLYRAAVIKAAEAFNPDVVNLQNVFDPSLINELNQNYPTTRFVHDHQTYCPGNSKYFFNSQKICPIATSPLCLINAYKEKCMTRRPLLALKRLAQRQSWLRVLKELPLLLCNSSYVRGQLILNGLEPEKILVNGLFPGHNLLDRAGVSIELDPSTSSGSNSQGKRPEILFVGRLFKEKGVDLLLKAFAKLPGQRLMDKGWADIRLQIVGEGWAKDELVGLSQELKIDKRVDFLGFKTGSEITQLYRQSSFLVLPSVWPEPFGMVGLEANYFGKPVIAFRVGGIPDWLENGRNGFLIDEVSVGTLKEKMMILLENPEFCKKMGQNGQERVQKEFTLEKHLERLLAVYRQLLGRSRK